MTISKRRGKQWSFRKWVRTPTGTVRVTGVPTSWGLPNTRAGAEEALRIVSNLAREGKPWRASELRRVEAPPAREDTVADFAKKFLELSEADSKYSAFTTTRSAMRYHVLPALGAMPLSSVTFAVLEDFKLALIKKTGRKTGKPLAPKTVNNVLDVTLRMLRHAHRRGLVEAVPELPMLKMEHQDFDFLTFEEAPRLVAAAAGEWRTMILVAWKTGLRQGELLGLRWEDVDLVAGVLRVRQALVRERITTPKSRKPREVGLTGEVVTALKAHRHLRGELVFSQPDGTPWSNNKAWRPLESACKRAGMRRIGWHVLRHTFASHLVMRGVGIKTVQELLGHATIQMTMRYAHLSPDMKLAAVHVLDDGRPVPDGARRHRTGPDSR
jgi:integrase